MTLVGSTDAAIQNRGAIRNQVTNMTSPLTAQAKAGESSTQLGQHLEQMRGALIHARVAAGLSGTQMLAYLRVPGFTSALVSTLVKVYGTEQSARGIQSVLNALAKLHVKDITVTTTYARTSKVLASSDHPAPSATPPEDSSPDKAPAHPTPT